MQHFIQAKIIFVVSNLTARDVIQWL